MPVPHLSNSGDDIDNIDEMQGIQEEALKVKPEATLKNITEFSERWMEIDTELKQYDEYCKVLEDEQKDIEETKLPDVMRQLQIQDLKILDGFKLKVEPKFQGTIVVKDQTMSARQLAWLEKNGGADIIKTEISLSFPKGREAEAEELIKILDQLGFVYKRKRGVHASTLGSFMKEKASSALVEVKDLEDMKWRYFDQASIKKTGFKARKRRSRSESSGDTDEGGEE